MNKIDERLPEFLFIVTFIVFVVAFLSLEGLGYLRKLEYNQIRDIVQFTVTADAAIIAFTGVIGSWILREHQYRTLRERIIKFIGFILLMMTTSIFFGLSAIIFPIFDFAVIASIIFLFGGIVEIFVMMYSIVRW